MDPESDRLISTQEQEAEAARYLERLNLMAELGIPIRTPKEALEELLEKLRAESEAEG